MTKAEIDAKMEDIIDFSEVREFIDTPVKRYSSGMYVKLAFSVAAHLDSEIMIMDEVLAVGDMAFQKKCLDKMRDAAKKEGRTVLYVSHNMNTIRQLCDRCIVLDKGRVVFEGDVEEAIDIYLQHETNYTKVEYDLSETAARPAHMPGIAKLMQLKLLDKDTPTYDVNEPIQMRICVKTERDFANLNLRLELGYGEDSPVGTVPILALGRIDANREKVFTVTFHPTGLTVGKYRVNMVLFETDECRNSYDIDLLLPAFRFEVQGADEIVWNHQAWGHIKFLDVNVQAECL